MNTFFMNSLDCQLLVFKYLLFREPISDNQTSEIEQKESSIRSDELNSKLVTKIPQNLSKKSKN